MEDCYFDDEFIHLIKLSYERIAYVATPAVADFWGCVHFVVFACGSRDVILVLRF
ncbi:hypothetical protein KEJ17_00240 [Candidatus Bathyarchaeota archaeon]|nr:hypothetical protein [Candidatus Bathyarchaeota archaeon]